MCSLSSVIPELQVQMNTGTRTTEFISKRQAQNLLDAAVFAYEQDRSLNLTISVNLTKAGICGEARHFMQQFLKNMTDWLGRKTDGPHYLWVLENPPQRGLHVHIMVHWPGKHRDGLGKRLRKWLKRAGGRYRARVLDYQNLRQPGDPDGTGYGPNFVRYLLKGVDPASRRIYGQNLECEFQGVIKGKRSGTSESIGKAARARAGFTTLPPPYRQQLNRVFGF